MTQTNTFEGNLHKRIIVVESDPSLRISLVSFLMLDGYNVTGLCSAYEFYLQVFTEPYGVAIIDCTLSDQNGLILAEYIRKNTEMRIITLSEPISTTTVTAHIKSGADINFVKPVDFRLLAASLANLFNRIDSSPLF